MNNNRVNDWILGGLCTLAAIVGVGALLWIIADLLKLGLPHISLEFISGEVTDSGKSGGIGPVILSTLLILACCLVFSVPVGVGCGLWISEIVREESRTARLVISSIDLLASVPSIVFGLFGMVFFCQVIGLGFSILSGGLTLACMILPILIRTTISSMQSLPRELRPAAAAVGLRQSTTLGKVLLPLATPGILVGIAIGVARALAETAALIFTSGYATRWPESLADSGRSISVHVYDLAMNIPNGGERASASALTLLVLILTINLTATFLSDSWLSKRTSSPGL